MATKTFKGSIKLRKDTEENWNSKNPLLLNGEKAVVVLPTGEIKHKTGNGVHYYSQLPFDEDFIYDSINGIKARNVPILLDTRWWDAGTQTCVATVSGLKADSNGIATLSQTASDQEYDAAALSGLHVTAQGDNTLTFKCRYGIPKISIPITVVIFA